MKRLIPSLLILASLGLAACGSDDKAPLKGERLSLFELEGGLKGAAANAPSNDQDASAQLPQPWANQFWPQTGGYANHAMQHLALGRPLKKSWSSDIGSGAKDDLPLTAQPVVADGRVYALDTKSTVSAFSVKDGKKLWSTEIMPKGEDDSVIGGGIAFSGGRLFATAGFNEALALNPADGKILWRAKLPSSTRAAPSAMPDRVYIVTVDNRTIALNAVDGKSVWAHQGFAETAGILGAASPAANRELVVPAYSSGEVAAVQAQNGGTAWSDSIAPLARPGLGAVFSDIRGLPVLDNGVVFAISYAGRMAAIDQRTGERLWEAKIGGTQTPWLAGNRLFVISTDPQVVSVDAATGNVLWRTPLPKFADMEDREGPIVWYGPVFAGGRLIAAGSNGTIREFDPLNGKQVGMWDAGKDVTAAPLVAGGTLYLLSANGTLAAWR